MLFLKHGKGLLQGSKDRYLVLSSFEHFGGFPSSRRNHMGASEPETFLEVTGKNAAQNEFTVDTLPWSELGSFRLASL